MKKEELHPAFKDLTETLSTLSAETAIIDKDNTQITYGDFEQLISGAYHTLKEKGIQQGDLILIAVPMSTQLYAVLEAVFALGATAVFIDPWMKGKKMSSVIRQVKPQLFIVSKKLSRYTWLLPATWFLKKWKVNQITPSSDQYNIAPVKDEDNALITFTSGTSGEPKGANRTYAFLHAQATVLKPHLKSNRQATSIDYTNFPIVALANLGVGNTVLIPEINLMKIHEANGKAIAKRINRLQVNRMIVSPSLLAKVLPYLIHKSALKSVVTGGAPVSIHLVKQALKLHPSIHFEAIYGSTEAEPICITSFQEIADQLSAPLKGMYAGKPVPEIELKLLHLDFDSAKAKDFTDFLLPDGSVGEVIVAGKHVNQSYYNNPEAFKTNKIKDARGKIWHRTGDVGYMEEGKLYLTGRKSRVIKFANQVFYPYPLEQYITVKTGITDVGYVQNKRGCCLYYYTDQPIKANEIKRFIQKTDYPIDHVILHDRPLPRDARHKSKLQIDELTH